jgi:hypothetical protein
MLIKRSCKKFQWVCQRRFIGVEQNQQSLCPFSSEQWEQSTGFPLYTLSSSTRLLLINQFSTAPRLSVRLSVGEWKSYPTEFACARVEMRTAALPTHIAHGCGLNRNAYMRCAQLLSRLFKYLPTRATHSPVPYSGKWTYIEIPIKFARFMALPVPNIKGQTVQANRWKIFQLSEDL